MKNIQMKAISLGEPYKKIVSPLPLGLQSEENTAIIIDENVFDKYESENLVNRSNVYAPKSFVRAVDKNLSYLIGSINHGSRKARYFEQAKKSSQGDYTGLMRALNTIGPEKVSRHLRGQITRGLQFCNLFTSGNGYLVDEHDKSDILGVRMKEYRKHLQPFRKLIPKAYLADTFGELSEELSDELLGQAKQGYSRNLETLDPDGHIVKRFRDNFLAGVEKFATTGATAVKTSNLNDDIGLVALACSIPAKQVTIYSNDSDVDSLTKIANVLLPLENNIYCMRVR
jgi:hypothetical protein